MVNHVWGLLTHPRQELQQIKREGESIPHLYTHHVLLLAAIRLFARLSVPLKWVGALATVRLSSWIHLLRSTLRLFSTP